MQSAMVLRTLGTRQQQAEIRKGQGAAEVSPGLAQCTAKGSARAAAWKGTQVSPRWRERFVLKEGEAVELTGQREGGHLRKVCPPPK